MNKEIKLEYMHLCDFASPAESGKINLLGIFDSFLAPKAPDFYIAAKISVETKAEYKVSFEIQSKKDNSKIFIDPNPIVIPANTPILNYNILKLIKELDFKDFGEYTFTVLVNDFPIGYKQIEVKKLEIK
jgi:hypothetical protein